eukprot:846743-Rhodomonas_salina.3
MDVTSQHTGFGVGSYWTCGKGPSTKRQYSPTRGPVASYCTRVLPGQLKWCYLPTRSVRGARY